MPISENCSKTAVAKLRKVCQARLRLRTALHFDTQLSTKINGLFTAIYNDASLKWIAIYMNYGMFGNERTVFRSDSRSFFCLDSTGCCSRNRDDESRTFRIEVIANQLAFARIRTKDQPLGQLRYSSSTGRKSPTKVQVPTDSERVTPSSGFRHMHPGKREQDYVPVRPGVPRK